MNTEDYDQITLEEEALEAHDLLKEGEVVTILFNTEDSAPLSVDMPASVVLEVTHSEPGVKGNTATNATKPATTNPGNRPKEPITSKNLLFAAILLKGLEKVVITQRIIATVMETGCTNSLPQPVNPRIKINAVNSKHIAAIN